MRIFGIGLAQQFCHVDLVVAAITIRTFAIDIRHGPQRLAALFIGQDVGDVISADFAPLGCVQQRQVLGLKLEGAGLPIA